MAVFSYPTALSLALKGSSTLSLSVHKRQESDDAFCQLLVICNVKLGACMFTTQSACSTSFKIQGRQGKVVWAGGGA